METEKDWIHEAQNNYSDHAVTIEMLVLAELMQMNDTLQALQTALTAENSYASKRDVKAAQGADGVDVSRIDVAKAAMEAWRAREDIDG